MKVRYSVDDPTRTVAEVAEAALLRRSMNGLIRAMKLPPSPRNDRILAAWQQDLDEVRRDIRAARRKRELGGVRCRR